MLRTAMGRRGNLRSLTSPAGRMGDGGQGMFFLECGSPLRGYWAPQGQLAMSGYISSHYHREGSCSWHRVGGGQGRCSPFLRARETGIWSHASVVRRLTSAALDKNLWWEQRPWAPLPGRPLSPSGCVPWGLTPRWHSRPRWPSAPRLSMGPPTPPSPARVLRVGRAPALSLYQSPAGSLQDANKAHGDCSQC